MKISDSLTQFQKNEIRDKAIEVVYEDAQQNLDYLYEILKQWVSDKKIEDQVVVISSDDDMISDLISFDPSTGKLWDEEE